MSDHSLIRERVVLFVALLATLVLLIFPARSLMAEYYLKLFTYALDDKSTDYLDTLPVSIKTMPEYMGAIILLEKASAKAPSRSEYHKGLSDIYIKLGKWAESMESMKAALPSGALTSKEAYGKALEHLKTAVMLEPANPNYHFSLGCIYDILDREGNLSEKEFIRAVKAYPMNASLRYAVSYQHLMTGRYGDALEHAAVLAKMEDAGQDYFNKALEIAWRASSQDPQVIKGIVPNNPGAKEKTNYFLKTKGIEE